MPIQHINDTMLHMMKRGFGKEKTVELLDAMRALPNSFVRTSFIVGHPGETEEMFDEMCEFAASFGFDRMNIFSYSDEETTPAYDMADKITKKTMKKRSEIMGKIASKCEIKSLEAEVGKTLDIVIDGESEESEYFLSAKELLWAPDIDGELYVNDRELDNDLEFGKIYQATITSLAGNKLLCTVNNA